MTKEFVNSVLGNNIPPQFIPAVEKGYNDCLEKGPLIGHPIERVRMLLLDGAHHSVDSSEFAFRTATHYAFREVLIFLHSHWTRIVSCCKMIYLVDLIAGC